QGSITDQRWVMSCDVHQRIDGERHRLTGCWLGRAAAVTSDPLPSGELRNPRIGDDPDTAACYPRPCYALPETLPIWSRLQTWPGFPKPYETRRAYDPRLRGL